MTLLYVPVRNYKPKPRNVLTYQKADWNSTENDLEITYSELLQCQESKNRSTKLNYKEYIKQKMLTNK